MRVNPIVKKYDLSREELENQLSEVLSEKESAYNQLYEESIRDFEVDTVLKGKVLNVINDEVIVDIGYKSEGVISLQEFDDPSEVDIGDEIEVLLEAVEDESGLIVLSKKKADRIRGWERIISTHKEGDIVRGTVTRKIKGGLLVDIGVPVFLPASQVTLRRTGDIAEYIGKEVEARIIKIDESRMNIVISRRKLLEERREEQKRKLLSEIEEGEVREGIVKNIADFGAFVDLGGIDGLLHITDMSWGRISHPSEVVSIDDKIAVKVLKVDRDNERIALGLKQKTENPWNSVELKYPVGSRVRGKVVNVMSYGAFVKLEEGVEGLVHVSEMSWTKRVNHPSELVNIDDDVDVVVLDINREKQEISLGMKQTEKNPWEEVEEKYPTETIIEGKVRNLTNYGAFIEIEEGIDGLLHVSDISWTKKVNHPSEVLKKGDVVRAMVLSVDQEKKRVALGMKQLEDDPWRTEIPQRYLVGSEVSGKITKLTNFGAFVELEENLEGLLHISELSDKKLKSPEEVVSVGQEIVCRIIRVDPEERKIGLSLVRVVDGGDAAEAAPAAPEAAPAAPEAAEEAAAEEAADAGTTAEPAPAEEPASPEDPAAPSDSEPAEPPAEAPPAESPESKEKDAAQEAAPEPEPTSSEGEAVSSDEEEEKKEA
jgi:small subunit ribosomal protein S1